MAITSPEDKLWWKQPLHRAEIIWIAIAFLWGLVMFGMMIYWHAAGDQNLSNEAYRIAPEAFEKRVEAMVAKHKVGEVADIPIVKPPAGSEVYMLGRQYAWWPVIQLVKGKSYRLHLSSLDVQHGFSLQPENINLQIHPGYEMVITVTPTRTGTYGIVCNEFCGEGHHDMTGRIIVVDK